MLSQVPSPLRGEGQGEGRISNGIIASGERGSIIEVRGSGLMWGIELDRPATPVARELLAQGFVVGTAREKVLRLLPPYIVPKKALSEFVEALGNILSVTTTTEKAA
jgi:acetylornithine aminotransferase